MFKALGILLAAAMAGCGGGGGSAQTKEPVRACEKTDLADCEKQCEAGSGASCLTLGYAAGAGEGVEKDRAKGAGLYVKACELDDAAGCHAAYSVYLYGTGVPVDEAKSLIYLKKACKLGHEKACKVLEFQRKLGLKV